MSMTKRYIERLQEEGKLDLTCNWADEEMDTAYEEWRRDIRKENERVQLIFNS